MEHPKVQTIVTFEPAQDSDKAWLIKGYYSWVFYRETNSPLYESQQVNGMFADPLMTGPMPLHQNFSMIHQLNVSMRDQPLSQVAQQMYDPSNFFDDVSHDENRNP
jgi:hypothetical protein